MARMRVLFAGRVQGVGFRATVQEKAILLGLKGTVRNLPNGTVELVAEGEQSKLDLLLEQIKVHYPRSQIRSLEQQEMQGIFTSFEIVF